MAQRRKRRLMNEINVVPYIDVMLVLLIIFMITAPLLNKGVEVELPGADAEPLDSDDSMDTEPVVLTIDIDGTLYMNVASAPRDPLAPIDVVNLTARALGEAPARQVLVKADRQVPYGEVVGGMVLLQKGGARSVGFVTDPGAQAPEPAAGR